MTFRVRPALPSDMRAVRGIVDPLANQRILLAKEMVAYYEAVQEFLVAESVEEAADGESRPGDLVGCGALHVMWADLAEVRTLAVLPGRAGQGVGGALLEGLIERARGLGLSRLFCLTFEVDFFARYGFRPIEGAVVDADVYTELLRSTDDGVAEFLDLARVKPNTLGNTRMLLEL